MAESNLPAPQSNPRLRALFRRNAIPPWLLAGAGIAWRWIDDLLNVQGIVQNLPLLKTFVLDHPNVTSAGLAVTGFGWLGLLVKRATPQPLTPQQQVPDLEWLTKRAEDEVLNPWWDNFRNDPGVVVCDCRARYVPGKEPYVDFPLTVFNGSVWPIEILSVRGYISVDGEDLRTPDLDRQAIVSSQGSEHVTLRQWLVTGHDYSNLRFDLTRLEVRIVKNPGAQHGFPRSREMSLRMSHLGGVRAVNWKSLMVDQMGAPGDQMAEDLGPPTLGTKQEQDRTLGRTEFYLLVNNPGPTARFQFQITAFPGSAKDWAVRWLAYSGDTREVIKGRSATLHLCRLDLGYAEQERLEATLGKLGRAGQYPPHPRLVFYTPSGEEIGFRYEDVTGLGGDALYLPDTCTVFQGELIWADTGRSLRFLINLGINRDDLSIRASVFPG
jgi:hypothetical protein